MQQDNNFRDLWLNNPARESITESKLSEMIGQYIVEAMQLIEKDNLRRQTILQSPDSPSEQKKEALNGGAWYSNDYFLCLKNFTESPFKERFEYFQKRGSFLHGFMDPKMWMQLESEKSPTRKLPIFHWKKNTVKLPSEELVDILEGKAFCLLECATVLNIARYAAILRVWGKNRFDRCFSGQAPWTLAWRISHNSAINPLYLFIDGVICDNQSQFCIGDGIGISSHPAYSLKNPYGAARAWNLSCSTQGEATKFVGFGLGVDELTVNEIIKRLIEEYNKKFYLDEAITTGEMLKSAQEYCKVKTGEFESSAHPRNLTTEDFHRNGGGLSTAISRLNAKKVKMILLQPENECHLFEVFKITTRKASELAMDGQTLAFWTRNIMQGILMNRKKDEVQGSQFIKK